MDELATTFEEYGRKLGLSEESVLDALVLAIRAAGPGAGGRFIGRHHFIDNDRTSAIAIEAMHLAARS